MEVKMNTELGLAHPNRGEMVKFTKPVHTEPSVPGHELGNKGYEQNTREMTATRPSQARTSFRVTGNTVNVIV